MPTECITTSLLDCYAEVLLRICNALNCDVGDIMEFVREENFEEQERKDAFPNG